MIIEKQADSYSDLGQTLKLAAEAVVDFIEYGEDEYLTLRFESESEQRSVWTSLAEISKTYREICLYRQPGSDEPVIVVYNLWVVFQNQPDSRATVAMLSPILERNFNYPFNEYIKEVVIPSFEDNEVDKS